MEKDPPVSLPVSGSRKDSFRQHSVGRPTSYLMPTIFISSCSCAQQQAPFMNEEAIEYDMHWLSSGRRWLCLRAETHTGTGAPTTRRPGGLARRRRDERKQSSEADGRQ